MSGRMKLAIAGVILGLILFAVSPWLAIGVIILSIGIPTTAGTGSEVGRSSVISDDTTHLKKIIFSPRLLAKAVFADPELTLDLPPHLRIATSLSRTTSTLT